MITLTLQDIKKYIAGLDPILQKYIIEGCTYAGTATDEEIQDTIDENLEYRIPHIRVDTDACEIFVNAYGYKTLIQDPSQLNEDALDEFLWKHFKDNIPVDCPVAFMTESDFILWMPCKHWREEKG
jgi:hypothetical protein